MGAAGDVGMDELRTGKVSRVSVNSAGSFVRSFVYLRSSPFHFYFVRLLLVIFVFFCTTRVFDFYLILLALQHHNQTPRCFLVSIFCNETRTTACYACRAGLDHDLFGWMPRFSPLRHFHWLAHLHELQLECLLTLLPYPP
jgi:hypothetical protein